MNQRELQLKRNQTARQYQCPKSNLPRQRNCVYFGTGDWEHERVKFILSWAALKIGHEFITEARGKDGNIVDFVDLDSGREVEIETCKERAKRFDGKDVTVFELW